MKIQLEIEVVERKFAHVRVSTPETFEKKFFYDTDAEFKEIFKAFIDSVGKQENVKSPGHSIVFQGDVYAYTDEKGFTWATPKTNEGPRFSLSPKNVVGVVKHQG